MHPKGTFCPAVGRPGEHPPGRKVLRSGCAGLHPAAKVESVLKVEPKSKRSQSRRGIPYLKVELGLYYVLLFHDSGICPVFLTISHEDLFHVEGYFLMMTAWRFVYPALFSSLCLWFPRFSGFALAFTRHFRADFRLYYGI
jgi:hypothetical protein